MMSDDVSDEDRPQHRELRPLLFSNNKVKNSSKLVEGKPFSYFTRVA